MEKIIITSRKNDTVKEVCALSSSKGRMEQNAFFIEGVKLWREAADAGFSPKAVFLTEDVSEEILGDGCVDSFHSVTREVYEKMSEQSAPEGCLFVFEKFQLEPKKDSSTLLLEGIQDPGNLGTILRSAAAFGCREVVGVGCCDVFSPKCTRATMGALFRVPYKAFDTLDEALSYLGSVKLYAAALSEDAVDFSEEDTSRACIMIGNEGHGLSAEALERSDKRIIIPIESVESLNASVAASILLCDAARKREKR